MKTDYLTLPKAAEDMTSADRLRWVADLLEQHPENHKQGDYMTTLGSPEALIANGRTRVNCGSQGCACGWGIYISPPAIFEEKLEDPDSDWDAYGAVAFGIEYELAEELFSGGNEASPMIYMMRFLARLPEEERTTRNVDRFNMTGHFLTTLDWNPERSFKVWDRDLADYTDQMVDTDGAEAFCQSFERKAVADAEAKRLGVQL